MQLSLAAVTAAAGLGLARLFAGGSFVWPVLGAAFGGHAVAWLCRRYRLGLLPSAAVSAAGLLVAVTWLVEPHTTFLLIPTSTTWAAISHDLHEAWQKFGQVKAPTPALRGFVLAAVAGIWLAATTSDFFAYRMRARFEAMAPAFTLFVFGSILGADHLRVPVTGLYLATLLAFVLLSEAARQSSAGSWFAGRSREGDLAKLKAGAGVGLAALVLAVLIGPHLPGAGSTGLVSWRDTKQNGSRSRVTVSPLVDIRGRLVDQSNVELFTVAADSPNYWRLTSLDRFDGTIWSSLGTYQPAKGGLPGGGDGHTVLQDYDIGPLGSIWLPAAYRADRVTGVSGARFDKDSGSLLADSATADTLHYQVVSTVPDLTQAALEHASQDVPNDLAQHYLELPADFPGDIVELAQQVTQGATTPYDKARALQDFFRDGQFTYDLDVPAGHDDNAMERFLFVSKRGYCEQFAGTFAAMARAIGLPARVAVGFQPGQLQGDGRYHVAGRDAHAWPEVYIGGYGWVAFEPTPGKNAPGTSAYTGINQATPNPASQDPSVTAVPTTVTPSQSATTEAPSGKAPGDASSTGGDRGPNLLVRSVEAGALLALLYLAAVPLTRRALRSRRRRRATTPTQQVLLAWQETEDVLGQAGHPRRAAETADEFAARAAPAVGEAAPDLARLAATTAEAGFAPGGVPEAAVEPARQAAVAVMTEVAAGASRVKRVGWALDPRPLLRKRT